MPVKYAIYFSAVPVKTQKPGEKRKAAETQPPTKEKQQKLSQTALKKEQEQQKTKQQQQQKTEPQSPQKTGDNKGTVIIITEFTTTRQV